MQSSRDIQGGRESEPDFAILEQELSETLPWKLSSGRELLGQPLPLPRWGSFSENGADSDDEISNIIADKHSSLDQVALALKQSAAKARHQCSGGTDQAVLASLSATEHNCALLAHRNEKPAAGHAAEHGNSEITPPPSWRANMNPHAAPKAALRPAVASIRTPTEPAGIHKHGTAGNLSDSEGDESDFGGVDNRYKTQKVHTVIQNLRERMIEQGIQPPSAEQSKAQQSRCAALRRKEQHPAPQHRAEVQIYQAVMRSKFEAIGVSEAQKDVFVDTACPSEAVTDALMKYHTHCRTMNRIYAMPGEQADSGLGVEDRSKLDHYVKDLQGLHSPPPTKGK